MIKILIFCTAVNAYQNIEGCSTKTFKYEEYGYQNVEDLRRQFRCYGPSISYSALPVTNNTIYDLYDLYNEIIENPDYDIYDANWTVSDTFGCACGIGACVDEEKTNITAPNGYIQCECAPGTKWNALGNGCVCPDRNDLLYNETVNQWECVCLSGIDDGYGNCKCASNQYWSDWEETCQCKESVVMYKSEVDGQCYCKGYHFGGYGWYCWVCHICVGLLVCIIVGALIVFVLGCFGITLCCTSSSSICCCCKKSESDIYPEGFVMEEKPEKF